MIDKLTFYHGAALLTMVQDERCGVIKKLDCGYLVNEQIFLYFKYRTKNRSPWQFTFTCDEYENLREMASNYKCYIIFICGGDGICGVSWDQVTMLLSNKAGWIAFRRNFREHYLVSGQGGELENKISPNEWPSRMFDELYNQTVKIGGEKNIHAPNNN